MLFLGTLCIYEKDAMHEDAGEEEMRGSWHLVLCFATYLGYRKEETLKLMFISSICIHQYCLLLCLTLMQI